MRISTETGTISKNYGDKKAIEVLSKAGFDTYDYSMFDSRNVLTYGDYLDNAYQLRAFADSLGMVCNQSHAPFVTQVPNDDEYNRNMFEAVRRALEVTSILGGRIAIVHPGNSCDCDQNIDFYNRLLPYAKQYNVKIALENMFNWEHNAPTACRAA